MFILYRGTLPATGGRVTGRKSAIFFHPRAPSPRERTRHLPSFYGEGCGFVSTEGCVCGAHGTSPLSALPYVYVSFHDTDVLYVLYVSYGRGVWGRERPHTLYV